MILFRVMRKIGISGCDLDPTTYLGLVAAFLCSSLTNSNSKHQKYRARVNLTVISAKVLPRQTLLPPRNGVCASGFLFEPSARLNHFEFESNLSGMNFSGSGHSLGSSWIAYMLIEKASSVENLTPPIVVSCEKLQ